MRRTVYVVCDNSLQGALQVAGVRYQILPHQHPTHPTVDCPPFVAVILTVGSPLHDSVTEFIYTYVCPSL